MAKEKTLAEKLRDLAEEAGKNANACAGIDDAEDCYYQGKRNAFNKAAELVEKEQKRLKLKTKTILAKLQKTIENLLLRVE